MNEREKREVSSMNSASKHKKTKSDHALFQGLNNTDE
jgi:hypothetical protein